MNKTYFKCCTGRTHTVIISVWTHKSEEELLKPFEKKPSYEVPTVKVEKLDKYGVHICNVLKIFARIEDTTDDSDTNVGISEAVKQRLIYIYDQCCKYCGDVHNWIPDGEKIAVEVCHNDMDTHSPFQTWLYGENCGGVHTATMLETAVESLRSGEKEYLY